ncbi:MAG: hypothetical protein IJ390_12695 [Lachnospiraceae bacterium]|nr:hypothetical protein [Lachnospiraceae bacterium]
MEWQKVSTGYMLRGARYGARLVLDETPFFEFILDGISFGALPAVSCFDRQNEKERLSNIEVTQLETSGDCLIVKFGAESNLWKTHTFVWKFEQRRAEYSHTVQGEGQLGRCFFFSSGIPGEYDDGESSGSAANARINVEHYFNPKVNLGNVAEYTSSQLSWTGLGGEQRVGGDAFLPERACSLFAPSPLFFSFYEGKSNLGIGLGTQPGLYRFNAFEYSGARKKGSAFYINYLGYTEAEGEFTSPSIALTFGSDPLDAMEKYVDWMDEKGYTTQFGNEEVPEWHYAPVFCGWAEQTVQAERHGIAPGAEATQANYEAWIAEAERRGIPISTIVIDDKWQKYYGTFEIDTDKWPDMKAFIHRQHEAGRHVVLWTASYSSEGVPEEMCVRNKDGRKMFADVANPAYEALIREQISYLVREVGVDGFKEDWFGGSGREADIPGYGKLHGIEYARRFQHILWDAAHKEKPDALIETQTPNPLYRESSDVLRLNDLWFSSRNVCETMQTRARISRICGWRAIDCDNASCTTPEEWFKYAQFQVRLGTPALYFLNATESFQEQVPDEMWSYLASLWKKYVRENF